MPSRPIPFISSERTTQALFVVWLVIAAFIGYLIVSLVSSRQHAELRVRDQARTYARLVDEHASATFDRANIALLAVADQLHPQDLSLAKPLSETRRQAIEKLLRTQLQRTEGIVGMPLANAHGDVIADALDVPAGTNLSDRQYFQTLSRSPRTSPLISPAILGRVSHKWGVILGRRINSADGSFSGMISANLGLDENFTYFYSTLSLGKNGAVSLRDPEDRLLMRYPVVEQMLGKQIASSGPIKERLQAGDAEGLIVIASAIDKIERVFAFRRLKKYPVYAAVGLSLDEALVSWRHDRDAVVLGAMLVILAGIFITIALRRQSEAEKKLEALGIVVESSQDAITTANMDGVITSWNAGAERLYGYTAEEMIGKPGTLIVPADQNEVYSQWLEKCRNEQPLANLEATRVTKEGKRIDVSMTISPIRDSAGRIDSYSVIARDITERKQLEAQVQQFNIDLEQQVWQRTAQLRTLSKRLAMAEEKERRNLSQDLHDDLGQILAMVKLKLTSLELLNAEVSQETLQTQLKEMETLVDQANRSVRSLSLQLSPPVLQQFGLVPALEWLADELQRAYDLKVHVSDDGQPKPLGHASSNTLFRAVRELLLNVHKHARIDRADLDISVVDDRLLLSVSDRGVGFDVAKAVTPSAAGGYGLFSVRERIGYIGGEMHIDSNPGDGTVVVLSLPLERRKKWRVDNDTTASG
ncbi:MAG: PAS domain S-box protein [Betaproteobacteria bacterium]|nr:PAS domain S-box protein [Betaproteobacteria bacterium]